jgi:hypothetical protein
MRIAVYGTRSYDRTFLSAANADHGFDLQFLDAPLTLSTARLAEGHEAVCVFVNDKADRAVLEALASAGVRLLALRCAGYNNVDLAAADRLGIAVVRVPAYSPHAVAEFTVGLLLSLDRKIHRAWSRVRENNFALDGLVGRNLHGRVAGVVGTGQIGALVARTLRAGFGCDVLASDPVVDEGLVEIGVRYVEREALLRELSREGQIFYVCPRIEDLAQQSEYVQSLVPNARLALAHGQMPAADLDTIMQDFTDYRYDVLLSTHIIESGIDIPRANTLIIHRAHLFGLAQLYQLRGRVGRSGRQGYAYFTLPAGMRQIPASRSSSSQVMPATSPRRCPVRINSL